MSNCLSDAVDEPASNSVQEPQSHEEPQSHSHGELSVYTIVKVHRLLGM
jgi:hypothetical protein